MLLDPSYAFVHFNELVSSLKCTTQGWFFMSSLDLPVIYTTKNESEKKRKRGIKLWCSQPENKLF